RELRDDPGARRALRESLYLQAAALAATVGEQPADHWLVAAGRALFLAGRFFDGLEARSWLDAGTALLWGQLREQVNEDGGHRARNPVAHALMLADYLEVLAFLRAANDDAPPWARKSVKSMADFLARLLHPDGELPLFHNAALGVARPARELLATAARPRRAAIRISSATSCRSVACGSSSTRGSAARSPALGATTSAAGARTTRSPSMPSTIADRRR